MQSASVEHGSPIRKSDSALVELWPVVPHCTDMWCGPFVSVASVATVNGPVVHDFTGLPSSCMSTSFTPSLDVQSISAVKPCFCADPFAGVLIFSVGVGAPFAPNRFVRMSISFCVDCPVDMHV